MRVTREVLRERLDAAARLAPDGPGGHGESYLAAMEALLPDAEALGVPGLLLEARVAYANAPRFKQPKREYREVGGEALSVLPHPRRPRHRRPPLQPFR